jgi:hypothetical protein
MLKKLLILSSALLILSCTNTISGGADETKEDQVTRLLKEADKIKTVEVEKTEISNENEEVVVQEEEVSITEEEKSKRRHKGMTRGEIMEYEMTRISEEMNALQADIHQTQEKKAQLKAYKEKLENLKRLNEAGIK